MSEGIVMNEVLKGVVTNIVSDLIFFIIIAGGGIGAIIYKVLTDRILNKIQSDLEGFLQRMQDNHVNSFATQYFGSNPFFGEISIRSYSFFNTACISDRDLLSRLNRVVYMYFPKKKRAMYSLIASLERHIEKSNGISSSDFPSFQETHFMLSNAMNIVAQIDLINNGGWFDGLCGLSVDKYNATLEHVLDVALSKERIIERLQNGTRVKVTIPS